MKFVTSWTLVVLALAGVPAIVHAAVEGQWKIDARGGGDQVQLNFTRTWNQGNSRGNWSSTEDYDRDDIRGLPSGTRAEGPVSMTIAREAGTIRLDGRMNDGQGSGKFTFTPDAAYVADLERYGFGKVSDEDVFRLCAHDVDRASIKEARSLGLRDLSLEGLIRMRANGVTPEFVRDLTGAGYRNLDVEQVIRLQVNGVTSKYFKGIVPSPGRQPTIEEIIRYKVNGLDPGYVTLLSAYFEPEEIVRLHLNGISADYVREFHALGYKSVTAEDLTRLRNNGVTSAFAHRALELHGRVTIEELIKLKINGIE